MPRSVIELAGQAFGRLRVLTEGPRLAGKGGATWYCRCDCGVAVRVAAGNLRAGSVRSCGCVAKEYLNRGGFALHLTPEYAAVKGAIGRCHRESDKQFKNYGARGIAVFPAWREISVGTLGVVACIGKRPTPTHSLDRKNNDGNYEPGNIRWADKKTQRSNQRKRARIEQFSGAELVSELEKRIFMKESIL